MSLDPLERRAWQGLIESFQPPAGYRLEAAFGSTFGLTFDAFLSALLAMADVTADDVEKNPLASVLAATRLSERVRVFVHAGSISPAIRGLSPNLAALLDRMIVPVYVDRGVFHPKLWVLRYRAAPARGEPDRVRVLIGSRNLTRGSALELGVVFEGRVEADGDELGRDVSAALRRAFSMASTNSDAVSGLQDALRLSTFDPPNEASESARVRWQATSMDRNVALLPERCSRAIVVSPFLGDDFLREMLRRSEHLRVVSTAEAYSKLAPDTFAALESRGEQQRSVATLAVQSDVRFDKDQSEEEAQFDGLHAKLVITDSGKAGPSLTVLGSANATSPGWALRGHGNIECVVALRPGLALDGFERDFIQDKKGVLKGWLRPFSASQRIEETDEDRLRGELQRTVRDLAAARYQLAYDLGSRTLRLSADRTAKEALALALTKEGRLECCPHAWAGVPEAWQSMADLLAGPASFGPIELADVSAFLIVRSSARGFSDARVAYAELRLPPSLLERRESEARQQLTAQYRPEEILLALVLGVPDGRHAQGDAKRAGPRGAATSWGAVLQSVSLESLLKAVSANPALVRELALMLKGHEDPGLTEFHRDLALALSSIPGQQG